MKDLKIFFLLFCAFVGFVACEESDSVGEFDNWKERNEQYIDSIATVARANADGKWKVILYQGLDDSKTWGNECYVYCHSMQDGTGTEHPAYTDSVLVNYTGRLIPTGSYKNGYKFDSSYDGEFDPLFDEPVAFPLSGTVPGFNTAIQHMVDGDTWKVYIPAKLGYGDAETGNIPAYSTLIFEIDLVAFGPIDAPLPR
jgi:FKBP-type peptidyl-prolyl cis-trans isomerase FklB